MAISTIGSYVATMDQFVAHWTEVDAFLSPGAVTLKGGYALADFTADQSAIDAAITAVEDADNIRQGSVADINASKGGLRGRLAQFRAGVSAQLPGTKYQKMLPVQPPFSLVESKFLRPMDDMASVWTHVNADTIPGFTGPLLLAGGYALAGFTGDLAGARTNYVAGTSALNGSRSARASRDILLAPARERMRQYRQAVLSMLPAGNALLLTVPALTPPPGSTPAAVVASIIWNLLTNQADITWTASDNANLLHYSIRTAPGPTYRAADESVVAEVAPGTLTYSTLEGLGVSGARALFRVYVVLNTLNERGSNTVGVTRP
jgi:hypothetical protein